MSLINEYEFKKCVDRYKGDRHAIKFNCRDQFMVMSFAQFTDRAGFDSSTIDLCLKLCPWAEFHHGKGAFKIHTLMDLLGSIPTFVMLTPGKVNDAGVMDKIPVEAGAFYLMDRGYVAFEKLYKYFQVKGAYFVL